MMQEKKQVNEQELHGMGDANTVTMDEAQDSDKEAQKSIGGLMRTNLLIDIGVLLLFLIIQEQRATGMPIHEWGGLLVAIIAIVHLLLHWTWIANATQRFFQNLSGEIRLNYIINILLFIAFTTVIFSGLMMSQVVLPFMAMQGQGRFFWRWLHATASDFTFWFIAVHVALHWGWVVNAVKRILFAPFARTKKKHVAIATAPITPLSESK